MNKLTPYFTSNITEAVDSLYQWDSDQSITFKTTTLVYGSNTQPKIHFSSRNCETAYVVTPASYTLSASNTADLVVTVPAALLEGTRPINVYLYEKNNVTNGGSRTTAKTKINIIPRARPENYDT